MHPLLIQQLAEQRQQDLRREAEAWRAASPAPRHARRSFLAGIDRGRRRRAAAVGTGAAAAPAVTGRVS